MRKIIFVFGVMLCLIYFKPITILATTVTTATTTCLADPNSVITGSHDFNYEIGSPEPQWAEGVSAKDSCDNNVLITVNKEDIDLTKEGTYFLYYYAKGTSVTVKVNVFEDMTQPEIIGTENITVEVNTTTVDYKRNVTVTDNKDREIVNKLVIDSSKVDLTKVGTYKLDYIVTDYKNNTTKVTVDVIVVDTTYPILENVRNMEIEVGQPLTTINWWDGVTFSDNSNAVQKKIDLGNFDSNKVGIYTVTYKIIDGVGNTTQKSIKVNVVDKIKPELILNRELKFKIGETSQINWLSGINIIDNYENIPLSRVICDTSHVNLEVPGTYPIIYFVSDTSGNFITLETEVIIYDDEFPIINNANDLKVLVNTEDVDFRKDITATDTQDGDLTEQIIIYDQNVNLTRVGLYKLFYIVMDKSGNTTIKEIYVDVYDDQKPVINGTHDLMIEVHTKEYDFLTGVTGHDNNDGNVTVNVDFSNVKFDQLGEYSVTYSAIDSNNNETEVVIKVTIVDTTKPVIEGFKDITTVVGSQINILNNIKATDNYDGDLTSRIRIVGNYDLSKAGEYQIKLEVEDSIGNYSSAYFKVIVQDQPIIEGVDQHTMYYIVGGVGATILVFGFISFLSRRTIRRR